MMEFNEPAAGELAEGRAQGGATDAELVAELMLAGQGANPPPVLEAAFEERDGLRRERVALGYIRDVHGEVWRTGDHGISWPARLPVWGLQCGVAPASTNGHIRSL